MTSSTSHTGMTIHSSMPGRLPAEGSPARLPFGAADGTREERFEVARHGFVLRMAAGHPLWDGLAAYRPFRREAAGDAADAAFTLEAGDGPPRAWPAGSPEYATPRDTPARLRDPRMAVWRAADGGWLFGMASEGRRPLSCLLRTDAGFARGRLRVPAGDAAEARFGLDNALMLLFALSTARRGTLLLHASAVTRRGRAFLFLGRSGTGKSTHGRLWLEHVGGSELLNDDNPAVRVEADGRARAYGTPWSGKTPCHRDASAPVGAVVRLRQSPANRIVRLGAAQAYASLYASCSGLKWEPPMADALHSTLEAVVRAAPGFRLECRADAEAARLCASAVDGEP